jgi:hypothetical protein
MLFQQADSQPYPTQHQGRGLSRGGWDQRQALLDGTRSGSTPVHDSHSNNMLPKSTSALLREEVLMYHRATSRLVELCVVVNN